MTTLHNYHVVSIVSKLLVILRPQFGASAMVLLCNLVLVSNSAPVFGETTVGKAGTLEKDPYQSVFINDPAVGKDPFFPISNRRANMIPVSPVVVINKIPENYVDPAFHFALKGISLSADKKLALVNNYTFAEGEEQEVRVADQVVKVRCVTIHERSAVISINGREMELTLREVLK